MTLTPRQAQFVQEYLIDLNATQAAIRAGYSVKTANEQAARLLANVSIQTAIQTAIKARTERTQITQDWVIHRLALLADSNLKKVCTWDAGGVSFTDSESLTDEDTYPLAEVVLKETIKEAEGGDELVLHREKRIKIATPGDKRAALETLGKHLGMFQERQEQQAFAHPSEVDSRSAMDAIKKITGE